MVCIHAVHPHSSDNQGLPRAPGLCRNDITSTSAPLCAATKKGRAQHPVFGPSPPSGLTLNHEGLILHPPQQSRARSPVSHHCTCEAGTGGNLCSHVIGAPAKCCTSVTAVNKAGEAREPQRTAARGSRDLQPHSSQRGKGWKKQNCHVELGCPRPKNDHLKHLSSS